MIHDSGLLFLATLYVIKQLRVAGIGLVIAIGPSGPRPPTFCSLWAANASGPPTFGRLIRPKIPLLYFRGQAVLRRMSCPN